VSDDVLDDVRSVVVDVLDKGSDAERGSWQAFADAGLLALAAPEEHDGSGFGLGELAVLLEEIGRRAVDAPVWGTLVCGLLTIKSYGTPEQRDALIPGIVNGETLISPAIAEIGRGLPLAPSTSLAGGVLNGTKIMVDPSPSGGFWLVSATSEDGPVAVLVAADADGVRVDATYSSTGNDQCAVTFADVTPAYVLGQGSGAALRHVAIAGAVRHAAALLAGALDLTAAYIKERRQFGRTLAEFQAVAVQIADVYIDSQMVTLAADEAVRRVVTGHVGDDLAIAAHAVCKRAPRALQTCHHLHGGFGVDITYALPDYFARLLQIVELLGGATSTLAAYRPRTGTARTASSPTPSAHSRQRRERTSRPSTPPRTGSRSCRIAMGPPITTPSARWAPTGGWGWAGPWSTAARTWASSSSRSSPTRPPTPTCTCPR
jgi:alkylation response protein AidB-like acyl-CoA dehydrogenase